MALLVEPSLLAKLLLVREPGLFASLTLFTGFTTDDKALGHFLILLDYLPYGEFLSITTTQDLPRLNTSGSV